MNVLRNHRRRIRAAGIVWLLLSWLACGGVPPAAAAEVATSPWSPDGVEDFTLTERSGKTRTKTDLLGRPWVACFVFTRCAGPCPLVTSQMKQLQEMFGTRGPQLVTLTVDPAHDTPEILARYAETWGADPEHWWFLTGDQSAIFGLIHRSFRMPVQETLGEDRKPGFEVIHSTNMMLVDAKGRIVGKFNATNPDEMAALHAELRKVLWVFQLPAVNASLNGAATLLLLAGLGLIRGGRRTAHKTVMLTAFATSIAFLACYLVYHFYAGSKPFRGTGPVRWAYFAILLTHVVLAVAVPVLASITIYRGLKADWPRHRKIAKITFPIWLYVSVTGVIIYLLLYHGPAG